MNEPKSRRELLEAAFDAQENEGEEGTTPPEGGETPPAQEGQEYQREAAAAQRMQETPPGETPPESQGAPKGGEAPPKAGTEPQKTGQQGAAPKAGAPQGQQPSGEAPLKAPISWRGEEKAHWGKIPKEAQQAILRRELETQQALSKSGQARNFVQEFGRTVMPYAHLIRAQNSTPLAAVDNLMRTAANLMVGNPRQKAQIVAEIISNYAVDVNELDQVLVAAQKSGQAETYGQGVLPPQFAQALKPIYDFMNQTQQSRQQYQERLQADADTAIEQFGQNHPHFEELREEMADIMEFAAQRGRKMTMEQAYQRALQDHPELQEQQQPNPQQQISQAASTLARARRASSSVRGAPAGGGGGNLPPPKNRREALERAWDEQTRGS